MTSQVDAIRITNLVKRYGNSLAVENLSLSVPRGSMFGFLGPNGSGKSTTIGCLTGLLDPTSGTVEILGGRLTTESADLKRRIGVMPETLGLFDPLYAHEFLTFVARMYGLEEGEVQQRVKELLTALELTDSGKTLAEYSTGMRKRVSFAAAVIHSPDVSVSGRAVRKYRPGRRGAAEAMAAPLHGAGPHGLHHQPRAGDRGASMRPTWPSSRSRES